MRPAGLALLAAGLVLAGCGRAAEPVITIPDGPAGAIGDGVHEVLIDIQAGRYRTAGPREGGIGSCFWYRLSGTGGGREEIIASGSVHGPTTVTIWPGDRAFRTEFCDPWLRVGDIP